MFKSPCCWLKQKVYYFPCIWERALHPGSGYVRENAEKGEDAQTPMTLMLLLCCAKVIHCSRRDVEGVWWLQSSPGQGSTMDLPGCSCAWSMNQSTAQHQGGTPRPWCKPSAVPCALLCSQPDGGKTLLTSLEHRGESLLLQETVEHHFSIPDGCYHVKHPHFWSCFNTESHVPSVTILRIFHLPDCYLFGQWALGMVLQGSLSLHLPMPFFLIVFSFASGSYDCIFKTAMFNCWRYLSVLKSMYLHMIIFFWL